MEDKREFSARDRVLALTLVFGPVAALLNLEVSYSLVAQSCANGSKWLLHLTAIVCFVLCLVSALLARSLHGGDARTRWMALAAAILSISGAIVIVAMEVPNLVLGSCQ
jgi:uncharacterized membrane protein